MKEITIGRREQIEKLRDQVDDNLLTPRMLETVFYLTEESIKIANNFGFGKKHWPDDQEPYRAVRYIYQLARLKLELKKKGLSV